MNLEDIKKQLDQNTEKIMKNIENINSNAERIQENSYALEILKDYKAGFNRWHNIAIVFIVLWILTVIYVIHLATSTISIDKLLNNQNDLTTIEQSDINIE